MDFEEGGDLTKNFDRFKTEKVCLSYFFTSQEYLDAMKQICEGLDYLHSQNLIHRDIKPQNILLSKDGTLKLCDLEFLRDNGESLKTFIGTTKYIAPEVFSESYTEKVDIYSLGKTILHLFQKVDMRFMPDDKNILENMEINYPNLHKICKSCLEIDPEKRMSAKEIIQFIHNCRSKEISKMLLDCEEMNYVSDQNLIKIMLNCSLDLLDEILSEQKHETLKYRCILYQKHDWKRTCDLIEDIKTNKKHHVNILGFYYLHSLDHFGLENYVKHFNVTEKEVVNYFGDNDHNLEYYHGLCYLFGFGYEKDEQHAFDIFMKCTNDMIAQFYAGRCYYFGHGIEKDLKKAFEYFKLSADQGNSNAQNGLAICYQNGDGIEKDLKKAIEYYKLSADQGNLCGQYNLAICYKNGEGIEKDLKKAFECYKLSADQGDSDAQYNLAICYYKGDGIEKDLEKAFEYFKLSADQGNSNAKYYLAEYIFRKVNFSSGIGIETSIRHCQ